MEYSGIDLGYSPKGTQLVPFEICEPSTSINRIFWQPETGNIYTAWKLTCPLKINGWKIYVLLKLVPFLGDILVFRGVIQMLNLKLFFWFKDTNGDGLFIAW